MLFLFHSGYMAPEYAMHGYLTEKADVYSFGIVALEIVSGRSNTSYQRKDECFYLLDWVINSSIWNLFGLLQWKDRPKEYDGRLSFQKYKNNRYSSCTFVLSLFFSFLKNLRLCYNYY